MTKFARPKPRFDKKFAADGVWFYPPEDEAGNEYGGFRLGLFDAAVPRVKVLIERAQRQSSGKRGSKMERIRENIEQFVDACLLDWDQVDADGKTVKFTRQAAVDYFMTNEPDEDGEPEFLFDYAFIQCNAFVRDKTHFQSELQVEAGSPEGN